MNTFKTLLKATFAGTLVIFFSVVTTQPVLAKSDCSSASLNGRWSGSQRQLLHASKEDTFIDEFSFVIKDFKMHHQGEAQTLTINILIRYASNLPDIAYPDFRLIAKDIENLLHKYPNKVDYWEVVNKRITAIVLRNYPVIVSVRSELQILPSSRDAYLRSSIVTRSRSKR